jgi:hypothetical protein
MFFAVETLLIPVQIIEIGARYLLSFLIINEHFNTYSNYINLYELLKFLDQILNYIYMNTSSFELLLIATILQLLVLSFACCLLSLLPRALLL